MQACSDLAHVVLVLVRRVTVVVVINFCVAIFVRELLYQEVFSLHISKNSHNNLRTCWTPCPHGIINSSCFVKNTTEVGGEVHQC